MFGSPRIHVSFPKIDSCNCMPLAPRSNPETNAAIYYPRILVLRQVSKIGTRFHDIELYSPAVPPKNESTRNQPTAAAYP